MEKIDLDTEDNSILKKEQDPLPQGIISCMEKINEIVDWINTQ